jgi:hypothetical protein
VTRERVANLDHNGLVVRAVRALVGLDRRLLRIRLLVIERAGAIDQRSELLRRE